MSNTLRADPDVHNKKGIYEYVLGGKTDLNCSSIRVFDDKTKVAAYKQQTQKAKAHGRLQLPAVRARRQRQQEPHLQS